MNQTEDKGPRSSKSTSQADKERPHWWLWAVIGILLLALCLSWFLLPLREWIEALQSWLLGLGLWGVIVFTIILIVITFLPAPDWPLPIAAGYVYGFWAFPLTYASIAFASVVAFLAARYLLRDKIRSLLSRRKKYRTLDKAVADDGWQVVVLMRLSPIVPFNLQNYALGVTAIPFLQYLTATLVGIVPGIAIYVYFGIFGKGLGSGPTVFDWVLFGIGVLATVALAILVARKTKTKLDEQNSA
ncbi:MAG: TVP38/TMEM64 family protein [Alphaproteobacteria bacterium]|nr:TVP38/TMEM64 family protein [Alphaproteobacteria bacterium]